MNNNILKNKYCFAGNRLFIFSFVLIFLFVSSAFPQSDASQDSLLGKTTLQDCIQYALAHQPSIMQSLLDEEIAAKEVHSKLADWFPQLDLNANFQHNYKLQTSIIQGNLVRFGVINTSNAQFTLTQTIFDRDVLLASSTAGEVEQQAAQTTTEKKIDLVVNVSKAFYSALLSQEQLDLVNQDLARLQQSQKDTYYQYKSGVVDKTDYMRATIALNNAKAEQKQDSEAVNTSYAYLKDQMGYPNDETLDLVYDRDEMENNIYVDTTRSIDFTKRIEYQLLQTAKSLQESNLDYYDWSFLPSLSAFGAYNFNFMNDKLSELYQKNYPTSYIGLQLSFPIFEGGKRIQQIQEASLELKRSEYDIQSFKNSAGANYVQALSSYKSNLNNYNVQKENLDLAKQVYNTIELQYKSGIKTYLDVITAETDLRTTEVNYISALYQVLSSKLDVQKALGEIKY
jgi:outer membrane protein